MPGFSQDIQFHIPVAGDRRKCNKDQYIACSIICDTTYRLCVHDFQGRSIFRFPRPFHFRAGGVPFPGGRRWQKIPVKNRMQKDMHVPLLYNARKFLSKTRIQHNLNCWCMLAPDPIRCRIFPDIARNIFHFRAAGYGKKIQENHSNKNKSNDN